MAQNNHKKTLGETVMAINLNNKQNKPNPKKQGVSAKNDKANPRGKPLGQPNKQAPKPKPQPKKQTSGSGGFMSSLLEKFNSLLPKPVVLQVEKANSKPQLGKTRASPKQAPRPSPALGNQNVKVMKVTEVGKKPNNSLPANQRPRPNPNATQEGTPRPAPKPKPTQARPMTYLKPVKYQERTRTAQKVKVEEIKDSRVLSVRPVLETVKNINDVKFFDRISLVNFHMAKNSGKLDERASREEHMRNTQLMQRIYTQVNFIYESALRNLEHAEHEDIDIQIDSMHRDILDEVLSNKLLSSFDITIRHENPILTKMKAEPIFLSVKLKKL